MLLRLGHRRIRRACRGASLAALVAQMVFAGCSSQGAGGSGGSSEAAGRGGSGGGAKGTGGAGGTGTGGAGAASGTGGASGSAGSGGNGASGGSGMAGAGPAGGSGGPSGTGGQSGAGGGPGTASGGQGGGGQGEGAGGGAAAGGAAGSTVRTCLSGTAIDVAATLVSGTLTVNGKTATDPQKPIVPGQVVLRRLAPTAGPGAVDRVFLGGASSGSYSALVMAGTYDLVYFSANSITAYYIETVLRRGIVVGSSPLTLDADVPATAVSGTVKLNGAAVSHDIFSQGHIVLAAADGGRVDLTDTNPAGGTYSTSLPPGTYDVFYMGDATPGAGSPGNTFAKLQSGIVIGAAPVSLNVDVRASKVSATLTINGAKVPSSFQSGSYFSLRNDAGDKVDLVFGDGSTDTTISSGLVVQGTYDLYYTAYPSNKAVAVNQAAKVQTGIVVGSAPLALTVDVKATTVSGKLTINGGVPAGSGGSSTGLSLRTTAGDAAALTSDATGAYSALVVPGTYDLYYSAPSSTAAALTSGPLKLRSGIVVGSAPLALDVDLPATVVSGKITAKYSATGPSNPSTANPYGVVGLVSPDHLAIFQFGVVPRDTSYSVTVPSGTYDLIYKVGTDGPTVPSNAFATLKAGIVIGSSPVSLDVELPASPVPLAPTVNGKKPVMGQGLGVLRFLSGNGQDHANVALVGSRGASDDSLAPVLLVPGTYDVYYAVYNSGPDVPSNPLGYVGCYSVP